MLTDEGEKQIVCGAPNARAPASPWCWPSPATYVPGIDVTLGVGKIRGVESHGMMASERELSCRTNIAASSNCPRARSAKGSWTGWRRTAPNHRPGDRDQDHPNRPDALGVRGVARDLAARGLARAEACRTGGAGQLRIAHRDHDRPAGGRKGAVLRRTADPRRQERPSPRGCNGA